MRSAVLSSDTEHCPSKTPGAFPEWLQGASSPTGSGCCGGGLSAHGTGAPVLLRDGSRVARAQA